MKCPYCKEEVIILLYSEEGTYCGWCKHRIRKMEDENER